MADGADYKPTEAVALRLEWLLAVLLRAGEPCQVGKLVVACSGNDWSPNGNTAYATLKQAAAGGMVEQLGDGRHAEWRVTSAGAVVGIKRLESVPERVGLLASGRLRRCPDCGAEHAEAASGYDGRALRKISDRCADHRPPVVEPGEALISASARPMRPLELRILGYLAAHPGRWDAATQAHREAVELLHTRRYVLVRVERYDAGGARLRVPMLVARLLPSGAAVARELGLECPGRATGECLECAGGS